MAYRLTVFFALAISCASAASANLKFAGIFTDHAVLQRNASLPIWGEATPGQTVTVTFAKQSHTAIVNSKGRWRVSLDPMPASVIPQQLVVRAKNKRVLLKNILIGDVWLCSGQSNMQMNVDRARDAEQEKAAANLPQLRVFTVERATALKPLDDCDGMWTVSHPDTAGDFSATAFFFGREIQQEIGVPIGLIVAAWSGSAIEAWTSDSAQKNIPALKALLHSWRQKDEAYTPVVAANEKAAYDTQFTEWKKAVAEANTSGKAKPKAPRKAVNPRDHWHHPTVLFNGMIAPLIPYRLTGVIWYQGETNATTEEASTLYETQLPLMINDWRQRWGQGEIPFAWIQLTLVSAQRVAWARIRESMRRAATLPNTANIVTFDIGEERLLHPKNKQAFGHRLALWARAQVYGQDIPWSGPTPDKITRQNNQLVVHFEHTEGQLIAPGDTPMGFTLQDTTGAWQPAKARIKANRVMVSHPKIKNPTTVRYAWANHPDGNLFNKASLPATPFELALTDITPQSAKTQIPTQTPKLSPANTPGPPTKPPLDAVDITAMPNALKQLDLILLIGQSNMKGRGLMPAQPLRNPQIVMMHKTTDQWFLARHPLHLIGNPLDFSGADNAGVGAGLMFAQTLAKNRPATRIGLIPCAKGGSRIGLWQRGAKLYDETVRRAKLAIEQGPPGKTRIVGALWLQGESDSNTPDKIMRYPTALTSLVDQLREDLGEPNLPFIACTIGEMREDIAGRKKINSFLLDLPNHRVNTACVDARDLKGNIGDNVHFDTATQEEIGRRYADAFLKINHQ